MKCRVISGSGKKIEDAVNNWLDNNKVEIFEILQTENNTYITISIFYYDKTEERKHKLNKINKDEREN